MSKYILIHHGILGQKWGKRNGPPYPLGGEDYSPRETKMIYESRRNKNSIYSKKHFDKVIDTSKTLTTLSYNKDRTKNTDMFYAAYNKADKHQYNALFNKKIPQDILDDDGNVIGTGEFYKFRVNNSVSSNIRVASEDSGANAFLKLYKTDRDFSNFVKDPNRMQAMFVNSKYKFKGYREAKDALERVRAGNPSEDDLRIVYRMYNYTIPAEGKDVTTQRAKMFKELKSEGYGALLDTNDAIYGGFKANAPVIVFGMDQIEFKDANRVKTTDKVVSDLAFAGKNWLNSLG